MTRCQLKKNRWGVGPGKRDSMSALDDVFNFAEAMPFELGRAAHDELIALRSQLAAAREALKPFASAFNIGELVSDDFVPSFKPDFTAGDYRRAAAALAAQPPAGEEQG